MERKMHMIYLDTAATTKPTKEVIADVTWCLENIWGNPSSIHTPGIEAKKILEQSREKVARFIGANPEEIIFCSSGSEANNLAIKGFMESNDLYNCIITTNIEHPSVYNTCRYLGDKYIVTYAPIDSDGKVNISMFERLISLLSRRKFCFVTIMLANNEIGTIQPIKEIARIVHKYDGFIHCDATQAAGQIPLNVNDLDCDLLTFSGHKINCPKGIGALYKKKGIDLSPIIHGGHQENGYVAGTENLPYIYALGNQVERINKTKGNSGIIEYLLHKIYELDECSIYLNGNPTNRLPNNLSLTFEGVNAEALITLLDMNGVCVSAGSACSSGEKTPSRILKAIGLTDEEAFSTIRISISEDTTTEECDEFVKILGECLESLKMIE
jgi:cysteine desulfurase